MPGPTDKQSRSAGTVGSIAHRAGIGAGRRYCLRCGCTHEGQGIGPLRFELREVQAPVEDRCTRGKDDVLSAHGAAVVQLRLGSAGE